MSTLEPTIRWLRRQQKNAEQAIHDLKLGQRIEFDGVDVTEEWIARYERLLERYTRLIETYEQRDREDKLGTNLIFRN